MNLKIEKNSDKLWSVRQEMVVFGSARFWMTLCLFDTLAEAEEFVEELKNGRL